jgi:hypothetical protein
MKKLLLILGVLFLASIEGGFAIEPNALLKDLPASFSGTYVWEDSKDTWNMSVTFSDRRSVNGEVQLTGMEHFVHASGDAKKFSSKIRAVVNAQTLALDLSEVSDKQQVGFTSMVYTGRISSDLRTIDAAWKGTDGKIVRLSLTATH